LAEVREGYERYQLYIKNQSEHLPESPAHMSIEELIERKEVVIGTPDDAIEQIHRLEEKVPNFGCLLLLDKNWASMENNKRSLEMMARYVLPAINGDNKNRVKSFDWARENRQGFTDVIATATQKAFDKHAAEE